MSVNMDEKRLVEIERSIDFTREGVEVLRGGAGRELVAEARRLSALLRDARSLLAQPWSQDESPSGRYSSCIGGCMRAEHVFHDEPHDVACRWRAFMRATEGLS